MQLTDLGSYVILAAVAGAYWLWSNRAALAARLFPKPPAPAPASEDEEWVRTLLRLKAEMESEGKADIAALVREILWRMMGGKAHE